MLWFRKGLRLHDNGALHAALEASPQTLTPVFCLDPWQVGLSSCKLFRLVPSCSHFSLRHRHAAGLSEATMLASTACSFYWTA